MYSFLEQSLDSDCSFDECQQRVAASYGAVCEKAGFAAHHIALRLEAEVKSDAAHRPELEVKTIKKKAKRSRFLPF